MRIDAAMLIWVISLLASASSCRGERKLEGFTSATFGIVVEQHGTDVLFVFKPCGGMRGDPFAEAFRVERAYPGEETSLVCGFFAPSPGETMRGAWRYGDKRAGIERCDPLIEGEYTVSAVGSGTAEARFSVKGSGTDLKIRPLSGGCP